ncbi:YiiX/YebB-like N1pC/P60 family cysteine hydrolase [Mollicutes bacterium LVI A0039]|nr:YiiX/YebB-like N1pC/P60 family cysteine hydrolase [Mollicutes bacterium LVI A0039]
MEKIKVKFLLVLTLLTILVNSSSYIYGASETTKANVSETIKDSSMNTNYANSLRDQLISEGYSDEEIIIIIEKNEEEIRKANELNTDFEEEVLEEYQLRSDQLKKTRSVSSDEEAFQKINPRVYKNKELYDINFSTGEFQLKDKDSLFLQGGTRSAFSEMQVGDFLVNHSSPSNNSKSFIGHAAIIETKGSSPGTTYTMEAYGRGFQPYGGFGVKRFNYNRVWHQDYKSKQSFNYVPSKYHPNVSAANKNAAKYAREQDGMPYNYNFFNTKTTDKFYCSQLVYRAWLEQGVNLNQGGGIVTPADLYQDSDSKAYFTQNF